MTGSDLPPIHRSEPIMPTITLPPAAALGLVRTAVISPEVRVADVGFNVARIAEAIHSCAANRVDLAVFPELCITGYSCADLFYHAALLDAALEALLHLEQLCAADGICAVVGLPLNVEGRLFNCAAFIGAGDGILGIVPKSFLPSTNEFYEERWFTSGERRARRVTSATISCM